MQLKPEAKVSVLYHSCQLWWVKHICRELYMKIWKIKKLEQAKANSVVFQQEEKCFVN